MRIVLRDMYDSPEEYGSAGGCREPVDIGIGIGNNQASRSRVGHLALFAAAESALEVT
jgi:hypothetical protein